MQHKKNGFVKSVSSFTKRIFRARNIIIISEHKVDHVPLSGALQILLLVGLFGLFSGVSYITGSYMTARSTIKEKDKTIITTSLARNRIGAEMDTLKNDIVKLRKNGKDLNSYSKAIIDQHLAEADLATGETAPLLFGQENLYGQNNEKLSARVSYLENRIQEITDENDRLVTAIRDRTDKKIAYFEDIISMTGLDSDRLESMAAKAANKKSAALAQPASYYPTLPDTGKNGSTAHAENQGGPFIPYDSTTALNDSDQELLANVDRLVLLHDIVNQLPLYRPINGAQVTGPFGKRIDPFNGRWAIHPGIDLAGPTGSHIYAASAGTVISAGHKIAYGNMVDIDHGFGIVTRYAHMSKILVKEGDFVKKGQQIGVQGSTGRSTGAHLHFEVRINDRPVNPITFLRTGEYVSENQ
jgi:murein DD-endopeptidase MepM/ murein hydrolase activator NlpD